MTKEEEIQAIEEIYQERAELRRQYIKNRVIAFLLAMTFIGLAIYYLLQL